VLWRRPMPCSPPRFRRELPMTPSAGDPQSTSTIPAFAILRSRVRRVAPRTRAEATMMRSAGSRWKLSGREATSAAMAGEIPSRLTRGGADAFSSQSRNGSRRSIRPRLYSVATSHREISEIHSGFSASAAARRSPCPSGRRGSSPSHQRRIWVSRRYLTRDFPLRLPNPRPPRRGK